MPILLEVRTMSAPDEQAVREYVEEYREWPETGVGLDVPALARDWLRLRKEHEALVKDVQEVRDDNWELLDIIHEAREVLGRFV